MNYRAICAAIGLWLSLSSAASAQMGGLQGIPGCGPGVATTALGWFGVPNGCVSGVPSALGMPVPTFSINFAGASSMPANTSFARASSATYFDSSGTLQTATTNTPRFGYDQWSKQPIGLIVEGATTNSIRNNTASGAVAGTPGTLPTNWSITGSNGLSSSVIGKGTANGISYVDIRIFGTSTAGTETDIFMESAGGISSPNSTAWTISSYLQMVGGSSANISYIAHDLDMQSSVPADLGFVGNGNNIYSNISPSGWLRFYDRFTTNNASVASVRPCFRIFPSTTSVAVDITLRIGLPQAEEFVGYPSSVIATSGSAVSRSADTPSFTGSVATLLGTTTYSVVAKAGATLNSNYALIGAASANYPGLGVINPNYTTSNGFGVSQLNATPTDLDNINLVGLSVGGANRYLTSNGGSLRGGTTASDTAAIPLGTQIATDGAQGYPLAAGIISYSIWNTPLTQSQLESASNSTMTTAWGDSLTAGTGSYSPSTNWGYTGWLGAITQSTIYAQGVGGQNSTQIAARCTADTYHTADNVIIEAGRNDVGGSIPSLVSNIQSCISHLATSHYVVVSIINSTAENSAATGTNLTNYNWVISANSSLASNFAGHYVDVRTPIVTASGGTNDAPAASYMYQGSVHPNDAGYQVMAQQIDTYGHNNGWSGY